MRGCRFKKNWALFLLVITIILILPICSTTTDAKESTITVGRYDVPGILVSNEKDNYSSYASEYMDEISKYTGDKYEFVNDSWNSLLKKLADGKIDIICTAQYSKERDKIYDYSDTPLGYQSCKLYAQLNDTRFYYDDFNAFDGMTVAALQGDLANHTLEAYAKENGFSFQFKYYPTSSKCFEALDTGDVDTVLSAGMEERTGYKAIGDISSDPFYIIVKQGNSQLLSKIDRALTKIQITDSYFEKQLREKYFGNTDINTVPSFTREEAEYIASVGTITVGNQVNRFPWSDMDTNGNIYGIQVDLLNEISKLSGLTFVNEQVPNTVRAVDYMNAKSGVRIFNGLSRSEFATFSSDIMLSDPLFTDSISFVAVKGSTLHTDDSVRVALPKTFVNGKKLLNKLYPNATVIFAGTKNDCLDALVDGSADFALLDTYISSVLLQKPQYDSLTTLASTGIRQDIDLAVLKSENPLLISIINKCINCIGENTKTNIVTNYTVTSQYQLSFSEYLYKYRTWFIWITVLVVCLIVILIITLSLRIRSAIKIEKTNNELNIANTELKKANDNLLKATQEANQANHTKSDFLARMSHDMRTPMNGILGMTDLCIGEEDITVLHDNIDKIKASGKYLLDLINETLDFQKIESGQFTFLPQIITAKDLLDSVNGIIEPMAEKKGVTYKCKIEQVAIMKYVKIDPIRIKQIFINILSNAIKFTPCGGTVEFTQNLVHRDNEYSRIKYTITDTGCGMSEEFINTKLFQPFSQEMRTMISQSEGTGLGLSIVKKLVDLMNGEIYVQSTMDKGSTFTIILDYPVIDESAVEHTKENVNQKIEKTIVSLKDKKILLVEDHPLNAQIATRLLEKANCIVSLATNGQEAIDIFIQTQQFYYDVILMDLRMPVLGGIEATRRIRSLQRADANCIPIIALSANAYQSDVQECLDAGINAHIAKPVSPENMYETIARVLKDNQ